MNLKSKWPVIVVLLVAVAAIIAGCAAKQPVETPKPAPHVFSLAPLDMPVIFNTPDDAKALCDVNLGQVERLRKEILEISGDHTQENTIERMNEIDIALDRIFGTAELMANTHPNAAVRDASDDCSRRAQEVSQSISMDPGLYAALKDVDASKLDQVTKYYVKKALLEYERSGVNQNEETRKKIAKLASEMVLTEQEFDKNIRDQKGSAKFKPEDLEGLPEDFMAAHPADAEGYITITTDYTDYFPVMNYAKREQTRAELTKVFNARAYPSNDAVFKKLLEQRAEYAKLVGYKNWAEYNSADKMAKNADTIRNFIEEIATITRPRSEAEKAELLELKKADVPDTDGFYAWDRFYYIDALKRQKFDVDASAVRQYFPYEKVKRGILNVASTMYGVTFQQSDRPVWHDSVEAYDVYEGDQLIARFYLDMHPREGKYGHAASFGMVNGVEGLQLPAATLVCNFPEPTPSNPGLMEHSDVETFFHEFGHLLHQLLAGRHHYNRLSGINCEWDFVEAPSQLFEDWAWDYDVLKRFAVNQQGEVIPQDLVERMKKSDEVGKGVLNMRQISYAALSFNYHIVDPASIDLLQIQNDIFAKYSPFVQYDGDYTFASFGHLNGYSSMYYTYMWSLAIAKDMAAPFHAKGLMNVETAHAYRDKVLSAGGSRDAADSVADFLGRPYNLDAFKKWLAE